LDDIVNTLLIVGGISQTGFYGIAFLKKMVYPYPIKKNWEDRPKMTIKELLLSSEEIVNTLVKEINLSDISLKEAEERILQFVNRIGQIMTDGVVEKVKESTIENTLFVNGRVATGT
jgi:hypothetical protein